MTSIELNPCTVCHKKPGRSFPVLFVTRSQEGIISVLFVTRILVVRRHGNKRGHQSILFGDYLPVPLRLINLFNSRCHDSILFPSKSGWPGSSWPGGRFQWKTLAFPRAGAGHITGKVKSLRPICEHYNNDLFLDGPGHGCHVIASVATDWGDRLLRFHGGWCWWFRRNRDTTSHGGVKELSLVWSTEDLSSV